jgi:hypothetical protein
MEKNKHDTVALKLNLQSSLSPSCPVAPKSSQSVFYLKPGGMSGVPEEMWRLLSSLYQADNDEKGNEDSSNKQESDGDMVPSPVEIGIEECELLFSFVQSKLQKLQSTQQRSEPFF